MNRQEFAAAHTKVRAIKKALANMPGSTVCYYSSDKEAEWIRNHLTLAERVRVIFAWFKPVAQGKGS